MAATALSNKNSLLVRLDKLYPKIHRAESDRFYWLPQEATIYTAFQAYDDAEYWTYCHELGHALLEHQTFSSDFELVSLEVDAWEKAHSVAKEVGLVIDYEYMQDRLDGYRDWLYQRSLCPRCELTGIQLSQKVYSCINCEARWKVSGAQLCRPYRQSIKKGA